MATQGGGGAPFTVTDSIVIDLIMRNQALFAGLEAGAASMKRFTDFVFSWRGAITGSLAVVAISLIKVGRQAVQTAAVLDTALREVATLLPQTSGQLSGLRASIIGLSQRLPQPPELLTRGFYQIVSAGITDTAEAFTVLEASAKAAVAGLTSTFTAADAITTVLNAFQLSATEANRISDVFFETIRVGKLRFEDIQGSLGDVVSSAALTGVTIEELSGALATLTQFGISADEAATSLNRTLLAVVNATDEERKAAKALGFDFTTTALRTKGLVGFMQQLNEATDANVDALNAIFPEIRAFRAVSVLAGEGATKLASNVAQISQGAGAAQTAFEEMNSSTLNLNRTLRNQLNAAFGRLGFRILPTVNAALEGFLGNLESAENAEIRLAEALGRSNEALRLRRELLDEQRLAELRRLEEEIAQRLDQLTQATVRQLLNRQQRTGGRVGGGAITPLPPAAEAQFEEFRRLLVEDIPAAAAEGEDALLKVLQRAISIIAETRRLADDPALARWNANLLEVEKSLSDIIRDLRLVGTLQRELDFSEPAQRIQEQLRQSQQLLDLARRRSDATEEEIEGRILAVQLAEREKALLEEQQRLEGTISSIRQLRARTGAEGLSLEEVQSLLQTEIAAGEATEDRVGLLRALVSALESEKLSREAVAGIEAEIARTIAGEIITQREFNREVENTENKFGALVAELRELRSLGGGFRDDITDPRIARALQLLEAGFDGSEDALDTLVDQMRALNALLREARLLSEFGLQFDIEDAGPELQTLLERVREIDTELKDLGTNFDQLDAATRRIAQGRVDRLQAERLELADEVRELRAQLEGALTGDAVAAAEQIRDLAQARAALGALGLPELARLPDEILELGTEIADLEEKIRDNEKALLELEDAQRLVRNAALQAAHAHEVDLARGLLAVNDELTLLIRQGREEVGILEKARLAAVKSAQALEPFRELIRVFPELEEATLLALSRTQQRFLQDQTQALVAFRIARDEAVANLALVEREFEAGIATSDALKAAEDRAKAATERFRQALAALALALRRMSGVAGPAADLIDELEAGLAEADDNALSLSGALNTAARALQGLVSAVDGLDLLSEGLEDALRGAVDLASGLAAISVDPIGGAFQAVGGAIGLLSGIFGGGESPEERARRESLEQNTKALTRLTESIDAQERLAQALTGDLFKRLVQLGEGLSPQQLANAFNRQQDTFNADAGNFVGGIVAGIFTDLGITADDLRALQDAVEGLDLSALIDMMEGVQVDADLAADQMEKLFELAREGIIDLMETLIDEFDERQDLLSQRRRLFPEDFEADPTLFLRRWQENLADALGGELGAQLLAFDISDAQGRRDLIAFLQDLFERGLIDPTILGEFDPEAFRRAVVDFADAVFDFEESLGEGTVTTGGVVKTITEATGNRIVGSLTTISVIGQLQLAVLQEILLQLGGTLPDPTQVISFRVPGAELELLAVEERQLEVLEAILVQLGGSLDFVDVTPLTPPSDDELAVLGPTPPRLPTDLPALQANFAPGSIIINDPLASPAAIESFMDQAFPILNQRLGETRIQNRRSRGRTSSFTADDRLN